MALHEGAQLKNSEPRSRAIQEAEDRREAFDERFLRIPEGDVPGARDSNRSSRFARTSTFAGSFLRAAITTLRSIRGDLSRLLRELC